MINTTRLADLKTADGVPIGDVVFPIWYAGKDGPIEVRQVSVYFGGSAWAMAHIQLPAYEGANVSDLRLLWQSKAACWREISQRHTDLAIKATAAAENIDWLNRVPGETRSM